VTEQTATRSSLGACTWYRRHRLTREVQDCGSAAVARIVAGCVHEHIVRSRACLDHIAALQSGKTSCHACITGSDPHECALIGRIFTE